MNVPVFVVCSTCHEAVALEWDPAAFAADHPLDAPLLDDWQVVEAALLFGCWPRTEAAPTPLAAGAWAGLAARVVPFARRHFAHPDAMGILISRALPRNATLVPLDALVIPARPPGAVAPRDIRGVALDERLGLASRTEGTDPADPETLLLMAWLPPDAAVDRHLLPLVLDHEQGETAEEALATRIVLWRTDPALRRGALLAVAQSAYARRASGWSRPRETPYDGVAPIEELRAGAAERLCAVGRVDEACTLAACLAVPPSRLAALRVAACARIGDSSRPAETRLRLIALASRLFPDIVGELRRDRGLARDPLPIPEAWAGLAGPDRVLASFTTAPAAVRSGLAAPDIPTVAVALEVVRQLASFFPAEAVEFEPGVRALCHDGRADPRSAEIRPCARARDVHAPLFAALGGTGAWEALREVIDAMLRAGYGCSLRGHFRSLTANAIPAERVGDLLVDRVADRCRPTKERIEAREALAVLAAEGGAVRRNEPLPSPAGKDAANRADDLLLAALTDPAEPDELKAAIRAAMTRWMPERIPSLRGNLVERRTIPPIDSLQPGGSIAGFDPDEVLALLRKSAADTGLVLSAIALAVPFARMTPALAPVLEALLRARIADGRRFVNRSRNLCVALEAGIVHRELWDRIDAATRPTAGDLLASLLAVADSQGMPGPGESSHAARLAETVSPSLSQADEAAIASGLAAAIGKPRSGTWSRLHAYHAMRILRNQGPRADGVLLAALEDPGEDPALRAEAHALLSRRMPQPVFALQDRGLLPRPHLPPVDTLYHNLPLFERDTEGEWLLTPEALLLGDIVHPDELVASLDAAAEDPSRACAAAALAPRVAQRLPAFAARLTEALRRARGHPAEVRATIAGRPLALRLEVLCDEGIRAIGAGA